MVLPQHIFQLRNGPPTVYSVMNIMVPEGVSKAFELHSISDKAARKWIPLRYPVAFKIPRRDVELSAVLVVQREDGEWLAILLGSATSFSVGFDIISLQRGRLEDEGRLETIQASLKPVEPGIVTSLEYHPREHSVRMFRFWLDQ